VRVVAVLVMIRIVAIMIVVIMAIVIVIGMIVASVVVAMTVVVRMITIVSVTPVAGMTRGRFGTEIERFITRGRVHRRNQMSRLRLLKHRDEHHQQEE